MTSLPKPDHDQPTAQPVLVASAGLPYRRLPADPIAAWLDLMDTVALLRPARERRVPEPVETAGWRL